MPKSSIDPESAKKIVQIKEKFDFKNSHLHPSTENDEGIFSKCSNYQAPKQARDLGIYPYFREIEKTGSSHVVIDGRDVITISSNNYLGLAKDTRSLRLEETPLKSLELGVPGVGFLTGH